MIAWNGYTTLLGKGRFNACIEDEYEAIEPKLLHFKSGVEVCPSITRLH
jgi:hypothetical protein